MLFNRKKNKVELQGRAGLIYKDNDKSMFIDSEMLTDPNFDMVIYQDSIKNWEAPYKNEVIKEDEKNQIRSNITKELGNLRLDWQ